MHCFASENQTDTGTVIFGIESLTEVFKRSRKPTVEKSCLENVRFFSKYDILSTNKMAFERTVTLREFLLSRHQI